MINKKSKILNNKLIITSFLTISLIFIANHLIKQSGWKSADDCFNPKFLNTIGQKGECKGKLIVSNETLRELVDEKIKFKVNGILPHIVFNYSDENIFTGQVTDMSNLFKFNLVKHNIENWNVSNVKDMSYMFYYRGKYADSGIGCQLQYPNNNPECQRLESNMFNQNIEKWDVSSVEDMSFMFNRTDLFNQPIGKWDVSNVKNMEKMFSYSKFNKPIGNWDVSKVTNMSSMFYSAWFFNQPLYKWDVSSVENMSYMFNGANKFNQNISKWCVFNVKDKEKFYNKLIKEYSSFSPSFGMSCNNFIED